MNNRRALAKLNLAAILFTQFFTSSGFTATEALQNVVASSGNIEIADAATNDFSIESAEPKYGKTWVASIICRDGAGTVNLGGGNPGAIVGLVNAAITANNLPYRQAREAFVRSDGASGGGYVWTNHGTEHLPTLNAICAILGYGDYVSSTCLDNERSGRYPNGKCNFHSPHDNKHTRFTGTVTFPACNDGVDNDNDGLIDYPQDPGCSSLADDNERDANGPECDNGIDDDNDGDTDFPEDDDCDSPTDEEEEDDDDPECDDGIDNDNDGRIDFPQDKGCEDEDDDSEAALYMDIVKSGPTTIIAGQKVTYTIVATNVGPVTVIDATVHDFIHGSNDKGFIFVPGDSSNTCILSPSISNPQRVLCGPFNYAPGQSRTFTLVFQTPFDENCNDQVMNQTDIHSTNSDSNWDKVMSTVQCVPAECSDGIDNDNNGFTDYPADPGCSGPNDDDEDGFDPICNDGIDNDNDGFTDFPQDPGCSSLIDDSERDANGPECDNGIDDDNDGDTDYPADSSCTGPTDDSEDDPECSDGIDNDNDGATDFPADASCSSPDDDDETNPLTECQDGIDNDNDGLTDYPQDPGCDSPQDDDEFNVPEADLSIRKAGPTTVQKNGTAIYNVAITNHGPDTALNVTVADPVPAGFVFDSGNSSPECIQNGANVLCNNTTLAPNQSKTFFIAFTVSAQTQCNAIISNSASVSASTTDLNPANNQSNVVTTAVICSECQDGIDNDNDGAIDFPADASCSSPDDDDETNPLTECQDGIDNDNNGLTDYPQDPGCDSPQDDDESGFAAPECNDGIDNDNDGKTDFPHDPGCDSPQDDDEQGAIDHSITLQADKASVGPGETITFIATVTNNGPDNATAPITFEGIVPSGLELDSGASSNNCSQVNNDIICNNITLAAGASQDFTLVFDVFVAIAANNQSIINSLLGIQTAHAAILTCGSTFGFSVQITITPQGDTNPNNNISNIIAISINCGDPECSDGIDNDNDGRTDFPQDKGCTDPNDNSEAAPYMEIVKTGPSVITAGQNVTYTLEATNVGPVTVTDVYIYDFIIGLNDKGFIYLPNLSSPECTLSASLGNPQRVRCGTHDYAPGQSRTFTVVFSTPADTNCNEQVMNQADVHGTNTDSNWDKIMSDVDCTPPQAHSDLTISKSGSAFVERGNTLLYTLTATNLGPDTATNVTVTDQLPTGLAFDSGNSSPECSQNGNTVFCNNTTLLSGQSKTFVIASTVTNNLVCGAILNNQASVASSSTDLNPANNQSQVVQTEVTCPTIVNVEKTGPTTVAPGEVIYYTITTINNGGGTIVGLKAVDLLQAGLTFEPTLSSNDCAQVGNAVECGVFTLTPNGVKQHTIAFTVSANRSCGSRIVNTIDIIDSGNRDIAWDVFTTNVECPVIPECSDGIDNDNDGKIDFPHDPGCDSPQDDDESDDPELIDLNIRKRGPSSISKGDTIIYQISVHNNGPDTATNVTIVDDVPNGLIFDSANSSPECSYDFQSDSVICTLPFMAEDSDEFFELAFFVPGSSLLCGELVRNQAIVFADQDENILGNNTSDLVATFIGCPGFNISKTVDHSQAEPGDTLNYEIEVENSSAQYDAIEFTVYDQLPSNVLFVSCSDSCIYDSQAHEVLWIIPFLARNDDITLDLQTIIKNDAQGTVLNTAWVANQISSAVTTISTATAVADLSIIKDGPISIELGATISYEITVSNNGPDTATNVTVVDSVPTGLSFNSGNSSSSCQLIGSTVVCHISDLPTNSGETFVIAFDVLHTVACQSNITNVASVSGSESDPNTSNNQSNTVVTVVNCPTVTECNDGIDNDGDGTVDYPQDPGCSSEDDDDEKGTTACDNGIDDDNDTLIDFQIDGSGDPECVSPEDQDEQGTTTPTPECSDGIDNDNDGLTDYPEDPGCDDADDDDETDTPTTCDDKDPIVTISLFDSQDPVEIDDQFIYTVRITNIDTECDVDDLDARLVLDSDTSFLSASNNGDHSNSIVTWENLSIGANDDITRTVTVRVDDEADDGDILYATAFTDNVSDQETTRVEGEEDNEDDNISINVTDNRDPVEPGDTFTYSIRICNQDNNNTTVDVHAFLDNDTSFLSASDNGDEQGGDEVEWDNIFIRGDDCETLTLDVRVLSSARDGDRLELRVRAEDEEDTERTLVRTENYRPPVCTGRYCDPGPETGIVTIDKSAGRSEVQPGSIITYTLSIRNLSDGSAEQVVVEDNFTAGSLSIVDAAGGYPTGNGIRWEIPLLGPSETRIIRYTARVNSSMRHGQVIINNVEIHGLGFNRPATDSTRVNVIEYLPQTGEASFATALDANNENLRFINANDGSESNSIMAIWTTMITMGMGAVSIFGKKLLF